MGIHDKKVCFFLGHFKISSYLCTRKLKITKYMTNRDLQHLLNKYPDDVDVYIDKTQGWEIPNNQNYVDVQVSPQYDEGGYLWGLEICPPDFTEMNDETIRKIVDIAHDLGFCSHLSTEEIEQILEIFRQKYE